MKKSIVTVVLVFAMAAFAMAQAPATEQQPGAAAGAQQTQPGAAPQPQKKEIKDPAEYQAYIAAINNQDPAAKAQQLEDFVTKFPNSVVKEDALEALMAAYQQRLAQDPANTLPKLQDTARRLLQSNPNHVTALTLLALTIREQAQAAAAQNPNSPQVQQMWTEVRDLATRGVQALPAWKPEGLPAEQLEKQKAQLAPLLNGAAGFAALQLKDYATAAQYLQPAVQANPNDVGNIYPLGVALLEQKPVNPVGLFYIARAAALSQAPAAQQQILRYGRSKYIRYHGDEEGWDQVIAIAKTSPTPPPNFTVSPAPSPAEQAAKMVQSKQVKDMSFDEFQFIFTSGNQEAADVVWNGIKGKPIAFIANVVNATPTKLTLSATAEDIQAGVPDVEITMADALPAKIVPKPGQQVTVTATPTSYTATPFMIAMSDGKMVVKNAPAASTGKKAAPARKAAPTTKKR